MPRKLLYTARAPGQICDRDFVISCCSVVAVALTDASETIAASNEMSAPLS